MTTMRDKLIEIIGRALDRVETVAEIPEAELVDAILAALREPSEDMMWAGSGAICRTEEMSIGHEAAGDAWRAMINHVRLQK